MSDSSAILFVQVCNDTIHLGNNSEIVYTIGDMHAQDCYIMEKAKA